MTICGSEQDSVHSSRNECLDLAPLLIDISSGVGNQNRVALLRRQIFDTPQDLHIKGARELGHHDPKDVRSLYSQATCQVVGLVVQSLNCAPDTLGQCFTDRGSAVNDCGDGRDGNIREPANTPWVGTYALQQRQI
jgi:hypothetical protein